MIPLGGAVLAWVLSWAGLGFPLHPLWWASLVVPLAWAMGLWLGRHRLVALGLYLSVALAGAAASQRALLLGMSSVALALGAWDMALVRWARSRGGARKGPRWWVWKAGGRSALLCGTGLGLGLAFATLRLTIPFWALVGGALLAWGGLALLSRALARLYGSGGGKASGNRSSSSPTR